jgi:hypothetical protein
VQFPRAMIVTPVSISLDKLTRHTSLKAPHDMPLPREAVRCHPAVVGSIIPVIRVIFVAGKPDSFACSWIAASSSAR